MNEIIVKRIKEARKARGLTQQELANYLNRTPSAFSDIERGKVQVSARDLYTIASVLNLPIEYFYGEDSYENEINDLIALMRKQTPDARKKSIETTKMLLEMQDIGAKFNNEDAEPDIEDIQQFLKLFIEFSKSVNEMNEQIKQIKSMIFQALKDQGIDLSIE